MWPRSNLWDDAIRGGVVVELNVDAYRGGVLLRANLPIEPGNASVTVDGSSGARRTCTLTISDPTLRPVVWTDMLSPAGTELVITSGVRYPDGTREMVPVGVFRITEPVTAFGGAVVVQGADRSTVIDDDKFIQPTQTITTNTVVQEITRIIQLSLPTAVVTTKARTDTTTLCPRITWEQDTSPWAAVQELATSISADLAPDAAGVFVIRPQPTSSDGAVWTVATGDAGIIVGGSEKMTRDNVFNAWTCRSDAADGNAPVQATAYDLDPASPTYWSGPFGHRPATYSSPALNTITKCTAAAATKLVKSTAVARQVTAQVIPNPALDYGDVAMIVLPDGSAETGMVQSFTLPLGVDDLLDVTFVSNIVAAASGPVIPPAVASVVTYTPHSSIPSTTKYAVTVNGQPSFVYSTFDDTSQPQPHWGKFTTFSMGTGQVTVSITTDYDVTSCIVRPSIQGVHATIVGLRQITLVLSTPGNYSIEPNANPAQTDQTLPGSTNQIDPLFLFATELENKPSPTDPNMYAYFKEGRVYTGSSTVDGSVGTIPSSGDLVVPSNKMVYIEGGSVFKGRLVCGASSFAGAAASGITVDGRGIIDATWQTAGSGPGNPVKIYKCSNTTVSNIVALSCIKWAFRVFGCTGTLGSTGVTVKNTRTFSWADYTKAAALGIPNSSVTPDGTDCVASTGVTFDGVFVRSRDDGLTMKNASASAFDGGTWDGDCHDNLVQNAVIWNGDAGNAFEIGWETGPSPLDIYNITYRHCDIIHKTANQTNSNSRGALGIHNCETNGVGGSVHDIRYEDIRIEDVIGDNTKTVGSDSYIYFTNINPNHASTTDVRTSDIYLKDVSVFFSQPSLAIQVRGYSSSHKVSNVTFENCTVNGVVLSDSTIAAANGYVHTAGNDSNVTFIPSQSSGGGTVTTLAASADAWVKNGGSAPTASGTEAYLRVKNSPTASVQRRSLIKFDATTAGLTSCTSAILRLWHIGNDSGVATTIDVYSAASDTWTEAVTWATQPALGTLLASTAIDPGHVAGNAPSQQYFEWDVTSYVSGQLGGDKVITLVLWQATATDNQITFNSRESVANTPQLVITP